MSILFEKDFLKRLCLTKMEKRFLKKKTFLIFSKRVCKKKKTDYFLISKKNLFSTCVEDCLRDWKLSWSLSRAVSLLSEWSLCTISCHWSGPRDIRCIKPSPILFCLFFFWKKGRHNNKKLKSKREKKRKNWANNKKNTFLQRDGKGLFQKKVDKEQIQRDRQEDFSLLPHRKSSNKRCLRNFLTKEQTDDFESFFFIKKEVLTNLFLLYSILFDLLLFFLFVSDLFSCYLFSLFMISPSLDSFSSINKSSFFQILH